MAKQMCRVDVKNTSRFDDALVRELVDFARDGRDHGHVAVNVKNCSRAFRGYAYRGMPSISSRARTKTFRRLVTLSVGADAQFPRREHSYPKLKTAPIYDIVDAIEALVVIAAHELTHCQQYHQRTPASEIHAEQSALRTLERFRAARLEERLPLLAAHDLVAAEAAANAPAEPAPPPPVQEDPTVVARRAAEREAIEALLMAKREEALVHALPEHRELLRSLSPYAYVAAHAPTKYTWEPGKPYDIQIDSEDLSRPQRVALRAIRGCWRDANDAYHVPGRLTVDVSATSEMTEAQVAFDLRDHDPGYGGTL